MMTDVQIDKHNFSEYFFNIRDHKPQKGQVLARFRAVCELVSEDQKDEKRFLIALLQRPNSAQSAINMMTKVFYADHDSAYTVPAEIAQDLLSGMSEDEVAQKPYEYTAEFYYYVLPQYVPQDDPHWAIINIIGTDYKMDSPA
jgi:hypothetical protein